jgi:hypothetical protein
MARVYNVFANDRSLPLKKFEAAGTGRVESVTIKLGLKDIALNGGLIGHKTGCTAKSKEIDGKQFLAISIDGKGNYTIPFPNGNEVIERVPFPGVKIIIDPSEYFFRSEVESQKKTVASVNKV